MQEDVNVTNIENTQLYKEIKTVISAARKKIYTNVNTVMIDAYCNVGN